MKRTFIISLLCLMCISLKAQDNFEAPTLTDAQKHSVMVFQANFVILNTINYAKSLDQSVEAVANFSGEQAKYSWNQENGFNRFVNGMLSNFYCFVPDNEITIIEQSDNMITFKTKALYPNLKNNSPQYNVTYDEYLTFWRIVIEKVADYLGSEYSQTLTEDEMLITIKKKDI